MFARVTAVCDFCAVVNGHVHHSTKMGGGANEDLNQAHFFAHALITEQYDLH